ALHGAEDADLLEVQEIAARAGVETLLLDAVEYADRGGLRSRGGLARVQAFEPIERAVDLAPAEPRALELCAQLVTVGFGFVITIGEGLEQIHEDVENGFFHQSLLARRA